MDSRPDVVRASRGSPSLPVRRASPPAEPASGAGQAPQGLGERFGFRTSAVSLSREVTAPRAPRTPACARRPRRDGQTGTNFQNTNTTRRPSRPSRRPFSFQNVLLLLSKRPRHACALSTVTGGLPSVVPADASAVSPDAEAGKTRKHRYERTSLARTGEHRRRAERPMPTNRTPCCLGPPERSTVSCDRRTPTCRMSCADSETTALADAPPSRRRPPPPVAAAAKRTAPRVFGRAAVPPDESRRRRVRARRRSTPRARTTPGTPNALLRRSSCVARCTPWSRRRRDAPPARRRDG